MVRKVRKPGTLDAKTGPRTDKRRRQRKTPPGGGPDTSSFLATHYPTRLPRPIRLISSIFWPKGRCCGANGPSVAARPPISTIPGALESAYRLVFSQIILAPAARLTANAAGAKTGAFPVFSAMRCFDALRQRDGGARLRLITPHDAPTAALPSLVLWPLGDARTDPTLSASRARRRARKVI